jgi:indole-3-glycerol phosphate synthase
MTNILETIAADTRKRVDQAKRELPQLLLKEQCLSMGLTTGFPFEAALRAPGLQVIAEVKKASPSKGLIAQDFDYLQIAQEYEQAGVAAISVLTEPNFFHGSPEYLREIAALTSVPVLRKDFIIDPHQIYEAKVLGASAILLICALLDDAQLQAYFACADALGLSVLFEAHDAQEIKRAVAVGARVIGVNNRSLVDFKIDFANSQNLRQLVPPDILFVSESGIKTPEDAAGLAKLEVDAVLIGEALMTNKDKAGFIGQINDLANLADLTNLANLTNPTNPTNPTRLD